MSVLGFLIGKRRSQTWWPLTCLSSKGLAPGANSGACWVQTVGCSASEPPVN